MQKAVELYRGGMMQLARACFARDPYCMDNFHVRGNVFLNDVFVFSLLAQADAHNDEFFHVNLKHGMYLFAFLSLCSVFWSLCLFFFILL